MALYLVDYENTGVRGVSGIEGLKSYDRLIILYGPKTGSVPFEEMVKITSSPAALEFIRTTKTAKNYLDFQLVSYLGYLIAKKSDEEYYIVSRDSGFDSAVDLWTERGIKVTRINDLTKDTTPDEKPARRTVRTGRKTKTEESKESRSSADSPKTAEKHSGKESREKKAVRDKEGGESKDSRSEKDGSGNKESRRKRNVRENKDINAAGQGKADNAQAKEQPVSKAVPAGSETVSENKGGVPTVPESVKKKVRTALKAEGLRPGAYRKLYACMLESEDKSSFNTALVHAFGQETANKYYKQVLPAFTAWKIQI
ncbi:MAG: hypothetical protein J5842_04045 [Lachnospiraceae bacterium]|nr:hypothetical protein [Lachnospiraceae bacterium]MBR5377114.1 hypothetical protein [Lachnospiraceae bacterium]